MFCLMKSCCLLVVQSDGGAETAARAGEDARPSAAQWREGQPGPGAPAGDRHSGGAGAGRHRPVRAQHPGVEEARRTGRGSLRHVRF